MATKNNTLIGCCRRRQNYVDMYKRRRIIVTLVNNRKRNFDRKRLSVHTTGAVLGSGPVMFSRPNFFIRPRLIRYFFWMCRVGLSLSVCRSVRPSKWSGLLLLMTKMCKSREQVCLLCLVLQIFVLRLDWMLKAKAAILY